MSTNRQTTRDVAALLLGMADNLGYYGVRVIGEVGSIMDAPIVTDVDKQTRVIAFAVRDVREAVRREVILLIKELDKLDALVEAEALT